MLSKPYFPPARRIYLSLIVLVLGLLLTACGAAEPTTAPDTQAESPAENPTATQAAVAEVEATEAIEATDTPETPPTPTEAPTEAPTETPTDTPTETPTPEPTATPIPPTDTPAPTETPTPAIPQVTLDVDLNVRSGPGVNFDRVGLLTAGSTSAILGTNAAGTWWQIEFPEAPEGVAWISAEFGQTSNTEGVQAVAEPPTPTPSAPPTATPAPEPTTPAVDFVVQSVRLRSNEENGGTSANGLVQGCGYGHNINILVVDPAGNPLDGVVLSDSYDNLRQITGSRGPGRAEFIFWSNGYQLKIVDYAGVDRPVTSEVSPLMSPKDDEIPIPWLIEGGYCPTEADCIERVNNNMLCRGHYSYDITFQRTW